MFKFVVIVMAVLIFVFYFATRKQKARHKAFRESLAEMPEIKIEPAAEVVPVEVATIVTTPSPEESLVTIVEEDPYSEAKLKELILSKLAEADSHEKFEELKHAARGMELVEMEINSAWDSWAADLYNKAQTEEDFDKLRFPTGCYACPKTIEAIQAKKRMFAIQKLMADKEAMK